MPGWAAAVFDDLRAANGGLLAGFFDVFAWREHGQVGFYEAKVGPDKIKPAQLRFLEAALRLRRLEDFTIVAVAGPALRRAPGRRPGSIAERDRQPQAGGGHARRQHLLRAGQNLLQALGRVAAPDDQQERQVLREVAAAIETRLHGPRS